MIKNIIIAALLCIVALFIINEPTYTKNEIIVKIDTVYQQKTYTKYKKGDAIPFVVLDTAYLQIHDTITIVKDYNQVRLYSDTMRIDSIGYAYIQDTISQNKIQGRGFSANFNLPTITITKILEPKVKNSLYLGFIGDLRRFDNKVGIGVGIGYDMPKKGLFTINATTNQYSIGYFKKL